PDTVELADRSGRMAWQERDDAVAYVGSLTLDRGVEEMVEAVGLAAGKTRVRFLLAGDFVSRDDEKKVRMLPGWKYVDFQGRTSRTETAALLGRAKAGLVVCRPQSNYMRAYPTKLFEYMAAGIPVVASDFPLWRGIVGSSGCGIMVDPLDTEAVSGAVVRLLEHPREAEEMGRRGREAVLDRYNWDNEEKTLLELYEALGRERKSPRPAVIEKT
ncbi:MAG: glycosyltransferase, partial [Candidatus Latescibacteria bacterium]|nr:glycosyltransferase [Candidatus Latescibacterota bacterium]